MEINLKEKLRSLRQKKNVTQEALANHLGITPQSVGKWERGEGFPDITLLPKIAFYFDVTVDDLLGVEQTKIQEKINAYLVESNAFMRTGENDKILELWEKAYSEFPNDCVVMENLMYAINRDAIYPCPKDKAERIIKLGEEILRRSTDTHQRESVIQELCYTYSGIDDQKALSYADMSGSIFISREHLRTVVLTGEEGVKQCQSYIMTLVRAVATTVLHMTSKMQFSHEEAIEAHTFAIDILKRLFSDDNVGFYAWDISYHYRCVALEYAEMNDAENTLKALEESCRYAIVEANLEDMDYTAPMVNRMKHRKADTSKNYKGNVCNLRLEELKDKRFGLVRNEERFKKIVSDLKKYAE